MKLKSLLHISLVSLAMLASSCVPHSQLLGLNDPLSGRNGNPRVYFLSLSPALRTYTIKTHIASCESSARLAEQGLINNFIATTISALENTLSSDITHLSAADKAYLLDLKKEKRKLLRQINQMSAPDENAIKLLLAQSPTIDDYKRKHPHATLALMNGEIYNALMDEMNYLTASREDTMKIMLSSYDENTKLAATLRLQVKYCQDWAARNANLLISY